MRKTPLNKRSKTPRCKACREKFSPPADRPGALVCSDECAIAFALKQRQKAIDAARKKEVKQDRERKEKLKSKSDWVRETQQAVNAYRREVCRIAGYLCICCDLPLDWSGNNVDAGHYLSRGSAPHLRFVENNIWAQRKQCNRYGSGRAVQFRIGLIKRIGLAAVEALEADNEPRHYTIEDLRNIRDKYRAKLRELRKGKA